MKNYIKVVLFSLLYPNLCFSVATPGIPVIDAGNLVQNVISALEQVNQTAKQIEQYETQLRQYENQLKNTAKPAFEIWDKANETIDNLNIAMRKLEYYQDQIGNFEQYLKNYKSVSSYNDMPCIKNGVCSKEDLQQIIKINDFNLESTRKSQEAAFLTIKDQQKALKNDVSKLTKLQNAVKEADGQMSAIQYGNQLASNQANQLIQMRALMLTQYNAAVTQAAAENNKEAQNAAISKQLRETNFAKSKKTSGLLK